MTETLLVSFSLNGEEVSYPAMPGQSLLDLLRANYHWDVKCGCGEGDCGACTLLMDNQAVKSCLVLACSCQGRKVETISGLGQTDQITRLLQQAFVKNGAIQCGFCAPGMLVAAGDYLRNGGGPEHESIRKAISGNLCRCTGYVKIVTAISKVAESLLEKEMTTND